MELFNDLFDVADDLTLGVARKVTPRTIRKPLEGEDLSTDDLTKDALETLATAGLLGILSDDD